MQFLENGSFINPYIIGFTEGQSFYELVYNASRDGWSADDFHLNCDGIGPTLVVMETTMGKTCGGYTSVSW